MSAYRYPFSGDGHGPGRGYYDNLRREPTARNASTRPAVDRGVKLVSTMNSNRPQMDDHDTREEERDDNRVQRDVSRANNAGNHLRAAATNEAHPSPRMARRSEDHESLPFPPRRRNDWQYETWLQTKSIYPPSSNRGRPHQVRASYPISSSPTARVKRLLESAHQSHSVRDINTLEHDVRNRISATVLADPSVSMGPARFKASMDYRRNLALTDAPVRHEQLPGVGSRGVAYSGPNSPEAKDNQIMQRAIQRGTDMLDAHASAERQKRSAVEPSGVVPFGTSDAVARKRQKLPPPTSFSRKPDTGMLDLLCSATLEVGPLKDGDSSGCSCSKSHCVKLYCECFKARRHCTDVCACANCKNTEDESGVEGVLTKAIRATLTRNPLAFTKEKKETVEAPPGELICRCVKSRCLKLYCDCFQGGRVCGISCSCVSCLNTMEESVTGGKRALAIRLCLEKRPDAFEKKVKEIGSGCACKNNRCLKKYCDCFRFNLTCGAKCSCKDCENLESSATEKTMGLEDVDV